MCWGVAWVSLRALDAQWDRAVMGLAAGVDGQVSTVVDPVGVGQALMAGCWLAALCFTPILTPDDRLWCALTGTGALTLLVLLASTRVRWSSLPSWLTLVFPLVVCVSLIALGMAQRGFPAPLTGLLTLCYAYVGLTRPSGTAILAIPVTVITLLCCYGAISAALTVRLVIAVFVWTVLAELLARLTRRQVMVTSTLAGIAHRDDLTGVPNRRDFDQRIATVVPGDSLVMCDIDRFKNINDTRGHAVGDRVLADFGAILRLTVRERDYCARYGGEEFVLILPATATVQAQALLDRLRLHWATLHPTITFSAGIAICTTYRTTADTLSVADAMLYAAKAAGRDRVTSELITDRS